MSFPDPSFSLIPAEDTPSAPDDYQATIDAALADAPPPPELPAPAPFGFSWRFDFAVGQFVRSGQSPVQVSELDTLAQWCMMAVHSARYAHPVFSPEFGMEDPEDIIGTFPVGPALADWEAHLIDALMVHDRVTAVQNVSLRWDPTQGILYVDSLDVITDDESSLTITDVTLQTGG